MVTAQTPGAMACRVRGEEVVGVPTITTIGGSNVALKLVVAQAPQGLAGQITLNASWNDGPTLTFATPTVSTS